MSSLSAEYRDRLQATQRNRRIRKALESRRNSGPVDVDDYYHDNTRCTTGSSSSKRQQQQLSSSFHRRARTPQPIIVSQHRREYNVNERRYQSAPRQQQLANSNNTVGSPSCLQSGNRSSRRQQIDSDRPPRTNNRIEEKKKSLSQYQLYDTIRKKDDVFHKSRFDGDQIDIPRYPINNTPSSRDTVRSLTPTKDHSRSQLPVASSIDDPRVYTASYYAKKIGINKVSDGDSVKSDDRSYDKPNNNSKAKHTHQSIQRSVSQKIADCLLPSKLSYKDEETSQNNMKKNRSNKKQSSSNALTSFCFVDNLLDVTHESIDITTIDVRSFDDNRGTNISALHEHSPIRGRKTSKEKMIDNPNHNNIKTTKSNRAFLYEDTSTYQTTTATSDSTSSDDEEEEDCTETAEEETPEKVPEILNVRSKVPNTTILQPQHQLIQVNPDDYDSSYRRHRHDSTIYREDGEVLSATATIDIHSQSPDGKRQPVESHPPQRDLQRRPRGIFELVTSNDDEEEDNNDDVATSLSTPYDESTAKAQDDTLERKYKRALQEMEQQRISLSDMEQRLQATTAQLEAEKQNVQKVLDDATERSRTYADATTKIVQDRIDSEDRLFREREENKLLRDEIECLKREIINLSLELERAVHRNSWETFHIQPGSSPVTANNALADDLSTTSNRSESNTEKEPTERRSNDDEAGTHTETIVEGATKSFTFMSEKLQASQREAADLQSQLDAIRTINELQSTRNKQLQRERDEAVERNTYLEQEILLIKAKAEELNVVKIKLESSTLETARLKGDIKTLKTELDNVNRICSDHAANVHRLEQELIRSQLEAAKYAVRVASLENELRDHLKPVPPLEVSQHLENTMKPIDSSRIDVEHQKEREALEVEWNQRFCPISIQQTAITKRQIDTENNRPNVEPFPSNTIRHEPNRRSSDLLDILREKLNS